MKRCGEERIIVPPPGGYVIIRVCMSVFVHVHMRLSVNTITQKIINTLTPNFAHTFAIAQGRVLVQFGYELREKFTKLNSFASVQYECVMK